eukprot:EG_transcript_5210
MTHITMPVVPATGQVEQAKHPHAGDDEKDLLQWLVGTDTEPLPTQWNFWMDSWELSKGRASMVKLACLETHDSAMGFWTCFQRYGPATLPACASLHIFKKGIQPAYDDPLNRSGGHFKMAATSPEAAELMWFTVARVLVKEALPQFEDVNGCTLLSKQKASMGVKLWIRNSLDKDHVEALRGFLAEVLDRSLYTNVKFCPHKYILQTLLNQRKADMAQERQSVQRTSVDSGFPTETMQQPGAVTPVLLSSGAVPNPGLAPIVPSLLPLPLQTPTASVLYQMQAALAAQQASAQVPLAALSQMYPGVPLPQLLMAYAAAEQAVLSQAQVSARLLPRAAPLPLGSSSAVPFGLDLVPPEFSDTSRLSLGPLPPFPLAAATAPPLLPPAMVQTLSLQQLQLQQLPPLAVPPVLGLGSALPQQATLSPNPLGSLPAFPAVQPLAPSGKQHWTGSSQRGPRGPAPAETTAPGGPRRSRGRIESATALPSAVQQPLPQAPTPSWAAASPTPEAGASTVQPVQRFVDLVASRPAATDRASSSAEMANAGTVDLLVAEFMRLSRGKNPIS